MTAGEAAETFRTIDGENNHRPTTTDGLTNGEPGTGGTAGNESNHPGRGADDGAIPDEQRGDIFPAAG
jgi:hypothetical protein